MEILSNVIDKQIKSEVQSAACEALNGLINNGTSGLFEVIDAGVTKFIGPPQPRPTPHLPDEQMVPFSTNKLLEAITDWIAQPQVVNDLVDCVTNHTGVAQIRNMNISFDLGDDNLTTTNLTLQNLTIGGLDTFTTLNREISTESKNI